MRKTALFIIMIFMACFLGACDDGSTESKESFSTQVQTFISNVDDIGEVTLDSWSKIALASLSYNLLYEEDKLIDDVITAKATLDEKEATYKRLEIENEEAEDLAIEQGKIDSFISSVDSLPELNALDGTEKDDILMMLADYDNLSEASKISAEVVAIYGNLLVKQNKVNEINAPSELADFISRIANVGEVTINSGTYITSVTYAYLSLSDVVKSLDRFAEAEQDYLDIVKAYEYIIISKDFAELEIAINKIGDEAKFTVDTIALITSAYEEYEKLDDSIKDYVEVEALKEKLDNLNKSFEEFFADFNTGLVNEFIELGKIIEAYQNIEKSDYAVLSLAQKTYNAIPQAEKDDNDNVIKYAKILNDALAIFESNFGLDFIGGDEIVISASSTNNITIGDNINLYKSVAESLFGEYTGAITSSALADYLTANSIAVEIEFFLENSSISCGSSVIDVNDLFSDYMIRSSTLISLLENIDDANSGDTIGISIKFVDKSGTYLQSDSSNVIKLSGLTW